MTIEQLKEIHSLLIEWREQRHLSIEQQMQGLVPNLLEEVVEYLRASDDYDRIDAMCDIMVFALNACEVVDYKIVQESISNISPCFLNIGEMIAIIARIDLAENNKERCLHIRNLISMAIRQIQNLGLNPYEAVLETIKEISSRRGEYNETIKKFVKYQGAYDDFDVNEKIKKLDSNFEIVREDSKYWYYGIKGVEQGRFVKLYRADYAKCKK